MLKSGCLKDRKKVTSRGRSIKKSTVCSSLEPDQYISVSILLADIGLSQIYWYRAYLTKCANIKTIFQGQKNARTSDFKWCYYVVYPAEGSLLFINY